MELNGRKINAKTVQVGGVLNWTSGRLYDPYFSSAKFADGQALTDDDLEELNQIFDVTEWLD